MKKFGLLTCVFLLGLSLAVRAQNVNLDLKNVSVKEAISAISQGTGYTIVANSDVVNLEKKVSVSAKNGTIKSVMDQLFSGQDVDYTIEGKSVKVFKKAPQTTKGASKTPILCKGKVVDGNGEPVIGAAIIEQNTNKSCITDLDGNFSLTVKPGSILKISNLGYSEMEIPAAAQMNITMKESSEFLDEVVVVGYGSQKKKDLTGAIAHVDVVKAQAEAPRSVGDLLRGKAAGLQMWQGTDVSGNINGVKVRGQNSIGAGTDAIIILDGSLFQGMLGDINPADIQSIDVLKDAAACAVYGANGAGGVILITTKKGEGGKPKVNFTANVGVAQNNRHLDILEGEDFLRYRRDMLWSKFTDNEKKNRPEIYTNPNELQSISLLDWYNYTASPRVSEVPADADLTSLWLNRLGLKAREIECYKTGTYDDWERLVYPRDALQQDYQISVSNRNEKCSYLTSVGYTDKEGAQIGMGYESVKGRVNIDSYITKWLTIGTNAMLSERNRHSFQVNDMRLTLPPFTTNEIDDPASPYHFFVDGNNTQNPFLIAKYMEEDWRFILLNMNMYAQITLPFGITFRTTFSPTLEYERHFYHKHSENITWTTKQIGSYKEHNESFSWQLDNTLNWGKTFGQHRVEATLLQSAEKSSSWNSCLEGYDYSPTDELGYNNMYLATTQNLGSNTSFTTGMSYMARLFYQYKGRYMLNASIRRDGYSAFGKDCKFGNFPAVGLAWTFSEENWLKNSRWLDFGKLRLSYGVNGNRNIEAYAAVASVETGKFFELSNVTGEPVEFSTMKVGVSNTSLRWESTAAYNIGLDLSMFKQRLDINADFWFNTSTDMLVKRQMLATAGFGGEWDIVYANLGELKSRGMDLTVNVHPIRRPNFSWDISTSLFTVNRWLTHLYGDFEDVLDENGNVIGRKECDDPVNHWYIGHDPDEIRDYEMDGVWQLGQEEEAAVYGCKPGDFRYVDQNGDGLLNDKDKIFTGKTYQIAPYTVNFSNSFNIWKNLTFSFLIYAKLGLWGEFQQAANSNLSYNYYNQPVWTETNPIDDYARYGSYNFGTQYRCRSFARVDNITLSYKIPEKLLKKTLFTSGSISLSARNPILISRWPMGDPENYRNYYYGITTYNIGLNFSL